MTSTRSGRIHRGSERRRLAAILALSALFVVVGAASVLAADKGELSFRERLAAFDIGTATAVAVSPDGKHLYATGSRYPGSISVFSLSAGGDDYTFIETERDGVDDETDGGGVVDGVSGAADVAISPDGKHVYVAGGTGENRIAIFSRDAATGKLSFAGTFFDGELTWPDDVAVSPDGTHVVAVSGNDDTVFSLERDDTDGSLVEVDVEEDGVNDPSDAAPAADGLDGAQAVAVAPDGEAVYVGTEVDDTVVAFSFDAGELAYVELERDGVDDGGGGGTVNGLNAVQDVLVSADNDFVYATGRSDNAVAVFERDISNEKLDFIEVEAHGANDPTDSGATVTGLGSPRKMALSSEAEQRNLYVAGTTSNAIANFRRNDTTGKLNFVESETDGVDDAGDAGATVFGLAGSAAVAVAGDNGHVYGVANGEGGVSVFERDSALGALSFVRARPELRFSDPSGLAVSPDGRHMVALAEGDEALYSLERNTTTGALALLDSEFEGIDDPSDPGGTPEGLYESSSVHFSPDGRFVYVTAFSIYSVAVFSFNQANGELSWIETEADGVDSGDGGGTVEGLYEPYDLAISPDGRSLYAPGDSDDAIAAFSRDPATGRIVFAEAELDGAGGGNGLEDADAVVISPDGKHVYVGAGSDRAVTVFNRNAATSELAFVETQQDQSEGGLDPGSGPGRSSARQPDGKQIYAAARQQLVRFDRNASTGALTLAELEADGVDDPTDPGGIAEVDADTIAISADGEEIYVAGDSTLATFSRDKATGALSFIEVEHEGADDPTDAGPKVDGLGGIEAIAVSPDDRFLYAAAESRNALLIFDREDHFVAPETTIDTGPSQGTVTNDRDASFHVQLERGGRELRLQR